MTKKCSSANPVNTTLKVIGGKWKPLILWLLDDKTWRFSDLQREMHGVTQKMLIQQLRELEKDGLVHRQVFPVVPPKVEYSLTDYAKSLKPVLQAMAEWGENHSQRF
jgi:DNA-binding HxlR family transcriptional regulator